MMKCFVLYNVTASKLLYHMNELSASLPQQFTRRYLFPAENTVAFVILIPVVTMTSGIDEA